MSQKKKSDTVTSLRARYQTLLRCLQSTASCCLNIIIVLVHQPGKIVEADKARQRISYLRVDQDAYNFFYRSLMHTFHQTNLPQVIELLVATNIILSSLETDVCPPNQDGSYVQEPLFVLYTFLLRICDESPVLILENDDTGGSHCSHIKQELEYFISEQIHLKPTLFIPQQK